MTDAPETLWVDPASEDDLSMYVGHSSDTMDYLNMDVEYTRTAYLVAAKARIAELESALDGLLDISDPAWNPVAFSNARAALETKEKP
jgi:hypothetical protein